MAKVCPNSALGSIAGTIDGWVYRRHRGNVVLQRKPHFTQPWSAAQEATRATFTGGSQFAAMVKADPVLRDLYAQRGRRLRLNYRQMAIRDYFQPPTVYDISTEQYSLENGGTIVVSARDDFDVVRITVALVDADRLTVAAGDAVWREGRWCYDVPPIAPEQKRPAWAVVAAFDRPGNCTTKEFPLP